MLTLFRGCLGIDASAYGVKLISSLTPTGKLLSPEKQVNRALVDVTGFTPVSVRVVQWADPSPCVQDRACDTSLANQNTLSSQAL